MAGEPRTLLLLHPDARLAAQVREAARHVFTVRGVSSWRELERELRTAPAGAVAVVDPYLESGSGELAPELRLLLQHHRSAIFVAAFALGAARHADAETLAAWGVAGIISSGTQGTPGISALLKRLIERGLSGATEEG